MIFLHIGIFTFGEQDRPANSYAVEEKSGQAEIAEEGITFYMAVSFWRPSLIYCSSALTGETRGSNVFVPRSMGPDIFRKKCILIMCLMM